MELPREINRLNDDLVIAVYKLEELKKELFILNLNPGEKT